MNLQLYNKNASVRCAAFRAAVIALLLLTSATPLQADGKMYGREQVSPTLPYQRALIHFRDGVETLILQSKYELPEDSSEQAVGWIVPLPTPPEVSSIPATHATELFSMLSRPTAPKVTQILPLIFTGICLASGGFGLVLSFLCLLSFIVPLSEKIRNNRITLAQKARYSLLVCLFIALFIPTLSSSLGVKGVDVISHQHVGVYEVKVLQADNAEDLIEWLNSHAFRFDEEDRATFEAYISRGWCFVVATIYPDPDQKESDLVSEGLAAPLILRFPHPHPVYPTALTATGGHETEILIYLAIDQKMDCGERLTLRYAGEHSSILYKYLLEAESVAKPFFEIEDLESTWLCKFKDVLSPAELRSDIDFAPAKDNTPYRERIVKW